MDYDSKDNMKEIIPVIVQRYCCPIGLAQLLLILAKGVTETMSRRVAGLWHQRKTVLS